MNRVTNTELQALVLRLNKALGRPITPYTMNSAGKMVANIGNFHLAIEYGGVNVYAMSNEFGAVSHVMGMYGVCTRRECADKLRAALWGVEAAQAAMQPQQVAA